MSQTCEITGLRTRPVAAAVAAILLALTATSFAEVAPSATPAEPEDEPTPELTEDIRFRSPNGKYALRIMYDAALNEKMTPHNQPENDGIFSLAMHRLAIVSLPGKEIMQDLTDSVFDSGNNFAGLTLMWSTDSKWCAFYHRFPRIGYTSVYHRAGDRFNLAHKPDELDVPSKGDVRNEYIAPERWVKPGVLELSVERIYRDHDEDDDVIGFTASFDGKGKWKVLKKKRWKG